MRRIILSLILCMAISFANAQTLNKTFLFDFGASDGVVGNITTSPDVNGSYWNNITNSAASATVSNLITTSNSSTAYGLKVVTKFSLNSSMTGLLTPDAAKLGVFAIPTATEDYFYTTTTGSFKLTALDKSKKYKFYFFNSRNTGDPARITLFSLVGLTSTTCTLQASGTNLGGTGISTNNSTIGETTALYPDANSEINITVTPSSGGYAYINALKVEEYSITYVATTAINVTGSDITNSGGTSQMTANLTPSDATPNTITWSVSDPTVATIDANGLLSSKKNGTVTVTASITQSGVVLSGQKQITVSNQLSFLYLSGTATTNGDNVSTALLMNTPPDQIGLNTGVYELGATLNNIGTFNFYTSQNAATATVFGAGAKADTLVVDGTTIPSTITGGAVVRAYLGTNSYKIYPNSPFKISQMGSSVSNGQGSSVVVTNSLGSQSYIGYAYRYGQLLNNRYTSGTSPNNWVLSNISIGGNDTKDVLARWDKDLLNDGSLYVVYALSLGNEGIISGGQAIYDQFKTNMLMLIAKARSVGKIPIVANVYPRADYTSVEYNYVKQMDMLIHEWDVPSYNLLGAIDDGTGKWPLAYQHDNSHPNDDGHTELLYAIVPSLYDALNAGKAQPVRKSGTYLSLNKTTANHQLSYTPENTFHSFTNAVDFKTTGTGSIFDFSQSGTDGLVSIDVTTGFLTYQSPNGGFITGTTVMNDGQWHNAALSHYYAQGFTVLYCDGVEVGRINEKLLSSSFNLFDANAPASVDYRNWFFYRSAMNQMEMTGLVGGKMLKSSLELYAPLDGQAIVSADPLVNLAQCTNTIQMIDNSKTPQTITFPSIPVKVPNDADFGAGATASSGLAISLASSNTAVATIVSGNIHIVGAGVAVITASQAGDDTYKSAISVRQTLTVNGTSQTITFPVLTDKVVGNVDYSPGATASSGLTVTYTSSNNYIATIVNGNIHLVGPGTVTIKASQAGNAVYNAAADVSQQLFVTSLVPTSGLFNEVFDYTIGPLSGQGSWIEQGTFSAGSGTRSVVDGTLNYADGAGTYVLSALGKSMSVVIPSGSTAVDYKAYTPFSGTSVSSGNLYLTILLKANTSISSTNQEAFGLADVTSAGPKILIGKTATGFYKVGTVRGSTASADYKYAVSPTSLTVGATNLIILKYNFAKSTSSIYVNPALNSNEPATPEVADSTSATIRTKLSNLWCRAQGSVVQNLTIGGVRISTTWTDAVETKESYLTTNSEPSNSPILLRVAASAIYAPEVGSFRIYNLQGVQIILAKGVNAVDTHLAKGLYIVCFSNEKGKTVVQKIIIR